MKVVRLSALRTGRLNPPPHNIFLVLISVSGCFEPRATVRPKRLCQWKTWITRSGIESATFWPVARCLNQLRYRVRWVRHVEYRNMFVEISFVGRKLQISWEYITLSLYPSSTNIIHTVSVLNKTDGGRIAEHWSTFTLLLLQCKSSKYYIFWVCVCSISCHARKSHAQYHIVICGLSGLTIFFHIIS
jgi:hypothetical protein